MQLISQKAQEACALQVNSKVLVALSGGADSVALLMSLVEICPKGLFAAHLNHGIRGQEAQRDEQFCIELCKDLNVPLTVEHLDVPALARARGQSLEQAARMLRYEFLRRAMRDVGAECIALGHHRGDQAETVLMHLIRGSGLRGLCAMSYKSCDLIRPLLGVSKAQILENVSNYCTDSTNDEQDATRNRVRLTLMPILSKLNPNIEGALCSMAEVLQQDEEYLDSLATKADQECGTDRRMLSKLPRPILTRVLIKRLLAEQDTVERKEAEQLIGLLNARNGTVISWRDNRCAWVDEKNIFIGNKPQAAYYCQPLEIGEKVVTPRGSIFSEVVDIAKVPCVGKEAFIDGDCISGKLVVRSRENGDRFTPIGFNGSKLLSDYLTDRKTPRFERDLPLVCDQDGIIYVAGHTIADRVKIGKETKNIIHLVFEEV
ncbi:MAG: tRNA lysidine(34) synthetase TilS [Eubacteriales bacterium]|nr:tRNA lysidine(34) synthetase TilS [Eubacteriales bacterium]